MKIYENEDGKLVIDGDNITTINVPNGIIGIRGVNEWLGKRFFPEKNDEFYNNIIVIKFRFVWSDSNDLTRIIY
jgi:hypothetical protein